MSDKIEYFYKGPVAIWDQNGKERIDSYSWSGSTLASSAKEAIVNLKFQYRKMYKMDKRVRLVMPTYNLREGAN